jgi:hypothetical protein
MRVDFGVHLFSFRGSKRAGAPVMIGTYAIVVLGGFPDQMGARPFC